MSTRKKLTVSVGSSSSHGCRSDPEPEFGLNSLPTEVLHEILVLTAVNWANRHPNYEVVVTTLAAINRRCRQIVKEERFRRLLLNKLFAVDPFQRYRSTPINLIALPRKITNRHRYNGTCFTIIGDELFVADKMDMIIHVYDVAEAELRTRTSTASLRKLRQIDVANVASTYFYRIYLLESSAYNNSLYVWAGLRTIIIRIDASSGQELARYQTFGFSGRTGMIVSSLNGHLLVPTWEQNEILDYDPDGRLMRRISLLGFLQEKSVYGVYPFQTISVSGRESLCLVAPLKSYEFRIVKITNEAGTWKLVNSITVDMRPDDSDFVPSDFNDPPEFLVDDNGCVIVNALTGLDDDLPPQTFRDRFVEVIDPDLKRRRRFRLDDDDDWYYPLSGSVWSSHSALDRRRGRMVVQSARDAISYVPLWGDEAADQLDHPL